MVERTKGLKAVRSGVLRSIYLCVCLSVRLSVCVCLSVREHISGTTGLHEICCADPFGRGSVLLWRRCDTLCTSGFTDDVTFDRNGLYGDAWKAEPLTYYH